MTQFARDVSKFEANILMEIGNSPTKEDRLMHCLLTPLPVLMLSLGPCASLATSESGAAPASAEAMAPQGVIPFAPEDLEQAGRVTLSPAFTPDGNTIYFTQADCEKIWQCPQLLMRSDRTRDGWSKPVRVDLPQVARADWPSVSPDGRTLWFSWAPDRARHEGRNVNEDFDLFRLDLTIPGAVPQPVDDPDINRIRGGAIRKTRFVNNETAPVVTQSGDLYFWSERLDGAGLRDIYRARSDGAGGFERPELLPAPINDAGENDGSWVSPDGLLMLFTTSARGSTAPARLHVSVMREGSWSEPRELTGSLDSDFAAFAGRITPDGKTLVFTSDRPVRGRDAGLYQLWQTPVAEVPELVEALEEVRG